MASEASTWVVLGKAMTSRMLEAPAISMISLRTIHSSQLWNLMCSRTQNPTGRQHSMQLLSLVLVQAMNGVTK